MDETAGLLIVPQERRQTPSLSVDAYQKLVTHFEQILADQTKGMCERAAQERDRLDQLANTVNQTQQELHSLSTQLVEHIGDERVELEQFNSLRSEMKANTDATKDILEIVSNAKGFFKGVNILGKAGMWALGIATAVLSFITAWNHFGEGG